MFYGKVNFGNIGYYMGKGEKQWILWKLFQPETFKLLDGDNLIESMKVCN